MLPNAKTIDFVDYVLLDLPTYELCNVHLGHLCMCANEAM